jgi:hypothetical protein
MRCLEMVLLVLSTIDSLKHASHSTSPEYLRVKKGLLPHLPQLLKDLADGPGVG